MNMSEQKHHTPGPWEANCAGVETRHYKQARLCTLTGPHFTPDEMGDAIIDGSLISAAPDLLEALERIKDYLLESHEYEIANNHSGDGREGCSYCDAIDVAETAIKKARGDGKQSY